MLTPIPYPGPEAEALLERLAARKSGADPALERQVADILDAVRREGDEAVLRYTRRFDAPGLETHEITATESEFQSAAAQVEPAFLDILRQAIENIESFHRRQLHPSYFDARPDGTFVGRGWGSGLSTKEGTALWENWLELRVPLAAGIIPLDGFLDAAALASDEYGLLVPSTGSESSWDAAGGLASLSPDNMAFSLGFGFRFAIPQFPFRFYFAKTFTLGDDWSFEWPADKGLDFVISITQPLY